MRERPDSHSKVLKKMKVAVRIAHASHATADLRLSSRVIGSRTRPSVGARRQSSVSVPDLAQPPGRTCGSTPRCKSLEREPGTARVRARAGQFLSAVVRRFRKKRTRAAERFWCTRRLRRTRTGFAGAHARTRVRRELGDPQSCNFAHRPDARAAIRGGQIP